MRNNLTGGRSQFLLFLSLYCQSLYASWQSLKEMNNAKGRGRLSKKLRKEMHQHKQGTSASPWNRMA